MTKCRYGEVSKMQKVIRGKVFTAKCLHGKTSLRRSFLTAKCSTAKCPTAKYPTAKKSGRREHCLMCAVNYVLQKASTRIYKEFYCFYTNKLVKHKIKTFAKGTFIPEILPLAQNR